MKKFSFLIFTFAMTLSQLVLANETDIATDWNTYNFEYQKVTLGGTGSTDFGAIGSVLSTLMGNGQTMQFEEDKYGQALPKGVINPFELTGWKLGVSDWVKTEFYSPLGHIDKTASVEYQAHYYYNGSFKNKGHYLANVRIAVRNFLTKALYDFTANFQVSPPINIGSSSDPIAALQVVVTTTVRDDAPLLGSTKQSTTTFDIDGLGNTETAKTN